MFEIVPEKSKMPIKSITTNVYSGPLSSVELLSDTPNILLSLISSPQSDGILADNNGTLTMSDSGKSTFNNSPLTYVGSGTVTPGVNVLGETIPLGTPVDVVVIEIDGVICFHYPNDPPNLLGAVSLVLDIDPTPYEIFENPYIGASGGDIFKGDYFANTMTGAGGDDDIKGRMGSDVISGGTGNDTLDGGSYNDTINGGDDNDLVKGMTGSDILFGDAGDDTIYGGMGFDEIDAGSGDDWVNAGMGDDTINGGAGNDEIYGNLGSDVILGGLGSDHLLGQNGNDTVDGDGGNDVIDGGWGHDRLSGGSGNNTLTGNRGADVFVFDDAIGADTVTDFQYRIDLLDFSSDSLINSFADFMGAASQSGADMIMTSSDGSVLTLENTSLHSLDENDFIFT